MTGRAVIIFVWLLLSAVSARADAAFDRWLQTVWPDAQALGVSRATFDAAMRGLEPDLFAARSRHSGQAREAAAAAGIRADAVAISARGGIPVVSLRAAGNSPRNTATRWRASRERSACPAMSCWRSGRARAATRCEFRGQDAIRVLATQAYVGKRKDFFRNEFLHALKMLQDGVPRADMRSSWGGAMGLTQFLPSEFYKYAVDFDGDGKHRHLAFGAGCARLGGEAARRQRLARGRALGDRGACAGQRRLQHRRARGHQAGRANGSSSASFRPMAAS